MLALSFSTSGLHTSAEYQSDAPAASRRSDLMSLILKEILNQIHSLWTLSGDVFVYLLPICLRGEHKRHLTARVSSYHVVRTVSNVSLN